ncbi:MAG: hypothetical protein SFV52_09065 [Saprospiraceae bacterium]|nr:hypothetical protein [Saprospiraceae bacterium]
MKISSTPWGFLLLFTCFVGTLTSLHAQIDPTLSVQGILKKANGVAVDDGTYSITFRLYTQPTGGTALWSETQSSVEVSSGIYSATLGGVQPFTGVTFDTLYYLGVTVGSTELTPRVLLTSAPYALSLIGQSNKFPSAGGVRADSMRVATNLVVNGNLPTTHSIVAVGGYLARGGAPGLNGANNNGYAFDGNSGDKDSGVFGTADGRVSLYSNNTEVLAVTPGTAAVAGDVNANGVNIGNSGSLRYNGLSEWRLVDVDFLENSADGWQYALDDSNDRGAWKNAPSGACPVQDFGDFAGWVLRPAINDYVVKKQFSPPGSYNYVKVVFKYFVLGNWDPEDLSSVAWAAFANDGSGNGIRVGWSQTNGQLTQTHLMNYADFGNACNLIPPAGESDHWITGEMIGKRSSPFWVYFGYNNDEGESDEHYAIGMIEVWVK